jgi:predicted transcriptional regulator
MYKSYLFNQLKEYLLPLQENALLEYEVSRSYRTTQKGLRLFQIQNRMEEVAPLTT